MHLAGWNSEGFVISKGNGTDILRYSGLHSWIKIETDKRNTGKGAEKGLYVGLVGALLIYLLALNHHQAGDEDMSGIAYAAAIPSFLILSVCTGITLGATSHKFEKYYYNKDEFKNNPFTINNNENYKRTE